MSDEPVSIWSLGAELGEGPIWFENRLWFVDIKRRQVHRLDRASGERRSWTAPEQVGFLVPRASSGFIAGLQSGLFAFDPESGSFDPIVAVDADQPNNRLNDATVDAQGRLWFGTMDDGEQAPTGSFYRYGTDGLHKVGIDGIAITNGPAISPDGSALYWVDTLGGTISVASIGGDGSLGESRLFARIAPEEGYPDGPTVDAEGGVWIGLYAGWEARRYSPAGEIVQRVRFPVGNITKVAFGGPDMQTMFATTARQLLSEDEISRQPQAGHLFALSTSIRGQACHAVRD